MARSLQSDAVKTTATSADPDAPAEASPTPSGPRRAVRSFVMRAGRTTTGQARAIEELGPKFVLPYAPSTAVLGRIYPQLAEAGNAPGSSSGAGSADGAADPQSRALVFEIGFGMGEATAHIAACMPERDFLCCEVHPPGVGALLKRIGESGLSNIRIVAHDAVEVLEHMLTPWKPEAPERGLDGVHLFFPDPWHKKRHNKRRLIQQALVARLASRLKPGGYIHCATDWQPYAEQMLQVLGEEPLLRNRFAASHPELGGYAPKPHYRPLTKFEKRGIGLGHGVWDLVLHRV